MKTSYVVLLRGINIGRRKVKSVDLRSCFKAAGYSSVQTVLATGNVLIESSESPNKLRREIEELLHQYFDFEIKIILISANDLLEIIKAYPFSRERDRHDYVVFMRQQIEIFDVESDTEVEVVEQAAKANVIYWQVQKGKTLKSKFAKYSVKLLKTTVYTTRNMNTLEKILKKLYEN